MKSYNKILIVSNKLGTNEGVGGRRWLYYGLELMKKGHEVFFLTYQKDIPSDLKTHAEKVFFIQGNYPNVLKVAPKTVLKKILYRLRLKQLQFFNKGSIYDEAVRTEKKFLDTSSKIISENDIDTLIITGAPFSLLYFGSLLKKQFPKIKYIADYRDGWTQGTGYGIAKLPQKKFNFEKQREEEVLNRADIVTVASRDISKQLTKINQSVSPVVIHNFVEERQFIVSEKTIGNVKKQVIVTHIGSVNVGIKHHWVNYLRSIELFKSKNEVEVKTVFVGNTNEELESYVKEKKICDVEFVQKVKSNEISDYILRTDFVIFFKHDNFPDSFPTKFFDYIVFKKPILCYSINGEVTKEIIENRIGFVFNNTKESDDLSEIFEAYINNSLNLNYNYDWSRFKIEHCVSQIEQLLNC